MERKAVSQDVKRRGRPPKSSYEPVAKTENVVDKSAAINPDEDCTESYALSGVGPDTLTMEGRMQVMNLVAMFFRMMKDGYSGDILLKMRDGKFTDHVGLSDIKIRHAVFCLSKNYDAEASALVSEIISREKATA